MNLFYTQRINDTWAFLEEEESKHLMQVLRKKVGDVVHLIDGKGGRYKGELFECTKRQCTVKISEKAQDPPPAFHLHLGIAPTKNMNRIEWLLEKSVEMGISEISLLQCFHSERRKVRMDRLERIVLSATKQSLKSYLPKINPLLDLKTFVDKPFGDNQKFIAYIDDSIKGHLKDNYIPGKDVIILIGPEGGFSPDEALLASKKGYEQVSLGPSRLRTETAGLVAVNIFNVLNQ